MGFKSYNLTSIFRKRPRLKDYPSLQPEVRELVDVTIKDHLKPNPVIRRRSMIRTKKLRALKPNFWLMKWIDLVHLREAVEKQNMTRAMGIVFGISEKHMQSLDMFNAFAAYKWIIDQLVSMAEIEKQQLGSELDNDEKQAGAERLMDFGYTAAVDNIARGDLLKHEAVLQKPYAVVFRKMCLDKVNNDIRKQYQENVNRKNQRYRGAA